MTYNICNAHGVNKAGELTGQDVLAVARVIRETEADIVGLNEVDFHTERGGKERDLAKEIGDAAEMYAVFGRAIYGWGGEYGNALLSRWPIEKVTVTEVSPGTEDGEETRSILSAEVATPEGRVRVMCTHFSWMHEHLRIGAAKKIIELVKEGLPTVVMGDLNTGPNTEPVRVLTEVLRDTGSGKAGLYTFPSHAPEMKIDYILTSPEVRVESIDTPRVLASDHLPLIAALILPWKRK
jgi:endonuclease/exonuclease/phosphatase family metal-dependent hydrolase